MTPYTAIVLAAGQGKRMKSGQNKQFLYINQLPLIVHTLSVFNRDDWCREMIVVINPKEREEMAALLSEYPLDKPVNLVEGGAERQDSVYEGLWAITNQDMPVFIHDGARPFVEQHHLHQLAEALKEQQAALLAVPVTDTVKQKDGDYLKTLNRDTLWAAQTPQCFSYPLILEAHQAAKRDGYYGTDDASLVERLDHAVTIVKGSNQNIKITTPDDLKQAESYVQQVNHGKKEEQTMFRIGQGFDVHELTEGRKCIIGGVEIPYEKGLSGHSDADVLLHTIGDACLGAIGERDIGKHFPDTDPAFKDADSSTLLSHIWHMVSEQGYKLGNLDCTIIAEAPKMGPYIEEIRSHIARLLQADPSQVNVKATTTEKLGFTGRKEGIAAQAVILLQNTQQ
ncbi:bifunctional 2-C-methyl-D-erythritol 4-phosphate cytidylyltransferase/2-C-methyl-D-erythritol 2,4-cyclodiphosphate synthase [Thalassobacillus sp. CUG 92003]|uniref:bifunctional 2-C-methyl-D-erythritol 4-phosphate cytidylyltransferase/2-C-methyl-D-erythritol 2,4-cyclodiphosphate synthase n=1 Tax=Thalassobacillus sp. CUG 92003 TaxID=2736641 RepID=UPI0015E7C63D|nr:bifunctional 2-C-methyl-D-erythritol 4-phosphate cytidylyltransferase/2-C-methyl-D-erythritol 2,4-cyclodiphosphate synthase [Thalassobacillus sp. CUG 92003]